MKLFSVLPLLLLVGCASVAGLGGKAHYVQNFEDTEGGTVDANGVIVPGQSTKYSLDVKGPAGMKWEEITSMSYRWSPTEGNIGVNSASKGDTLATAEAIVNNNTAMMNLMNQFVSTVAPLAAPLVGQSIAGRQANEAARIQSNAAFRAQLIEALKELGVKPAPVPPLVPTPEDDVLGVPLTLPGTGGGN